MNHEDIARAAELIHGSHRIAALTGAGISKPSGIPDFRSDSGIWREYDPFEVASLDAFRRNPARFYQWISPLVGTIEQAKPNPAHYALAQLEQAGRLQAVVTQNIDGLHQRAGSKEVFELHGHLRSATCLECGRQVPSTTILRDAQRGRIPLCSCGGAFKPDVVLFNELLPQGLFWLAQRAIEHCDLLIVAGTSLEVFPVSEMPALAKRHGARLILVNLDETYIDTRADVLFHEDVAIVLPMIVEAAIRP
jgi:NAD-dependent deacetylase